jgi:hypothetical protein
MFMKRFNSFRCLTYVNGLKWWSLTELLLILEKMQNSQTFKEKIKNVLEKSRSKYLKGTGPRDGFFSDAPPSEKIL